MTTIERDSWDQWYMRLARFVARRSRDPSTKVGAVIVRPDKTQVSFGYNDFPRGVEHYPERYERREWKYPAVVHAETNAILNAREPLAGCTIYTTFHPCARCASMIVQSGISCVVCPNEEIPERWREDMNIAQTILFEGGVQTIRIAAPEHDFQLVDFLRRQHIWSERTFGPGDRSAGVVAHIRKELAEIEADPRDITEWIDIAILAFDGARRAGYSPEEVAAAMMSKQIKNEQRQWPDWRTVGADQPIEHIRDGETQEAGR